MATRPHAETAPAAVQRAVEAATPPPEETDPAMPTEPNPEYSTVREARYAQYERHIHDLEASLERANGCIGDLVESHAMLVRLLSATAPNPVQPGSEGAQGDARPEPEHE